MKKFLGNTSAPRGVALLMVLTVLTVLSILSATFATFIGLESQSGAISVGQTQSDMLAQSALQHAYGLLREDYYNSSAYDDYSDVKFSHCSQHSGKEHRLTELNVRL